METLTAMVKSICGGCGDSQSIRAGTQALSRKLAMLAEVPFALARNMLDLEKPIVRYYQGYPPPPPWRAWNRGSNPPSVHQVKKNGTFVISIVLFALQGREAQLKFRNFEVFQLPSHLGSFGCLQIQREENVSSWARPPCTSSMMGMLASIWGAFFLGHVRSATFPCFAPAKPPPC